MDIYVALLLGVVDFALAWALWWWRGHDKPLPAKLEWMRDHRLTAWLCAKMQQPIHAGF